MRTAAMAMAALPFDQSPPRPGIIAGSFAEADSAGVIVGPLDGDLDELGARARETDEGFGAERESTRVGRYLQRRESRTTHELQATTRIGHAGTGQHPPKT